MTPSDSSIMSFQCTWMGDCSWHTRQSGAIWQRHIHTCKQLVLCHYMESPPVGLNQQPFSHRPSMLTEYITMRHADLISNNMLRPITNSACYLLTTFWSSYKHAHDFWQYITMASNLEAFDEIGKNEKQLCSGCTSFFVYFCLVKFRPWTRSK